MRSVPTALMVSHTTVHTGHQGREAATQPGKAHTGTDPCPASLVLTGEPASPPSMALLPSR